MRAYEIHYCRFLALIHGLVALSGAGGCGVLAVAPDLLPSAVPWDHLRATVLLYGLVGVLNLLAAILVFRRDRGSEILSLVGGLTLMLWVGVQHVLVHSFEDLLPVFLGTATFLVVSAVWLFRTRRP